ncbi:MAG: hypothetical protein ACR2PR_08210 [Pseudohongiellaceae bacterium]
MLRLFLVSSTLLITTLAWAHKVDPAEQVLERPINPDGYFTDKHAALSVEADFDGNGVLDQAFYVVDATERYALVVFMNNGTRTFELRQYSSLIDVGIELAEPGVYPSWCANDGCPDEGDGPLELRLLREGIVAGYHDPNHSWRYMPAALIYYWQDGHFHSFEHIGYTTRNSQ